MAAGKGTLLVATGADGEAALVLLGGTESAGAATAVAVAGAGETAGGAGLFVFESVTVAGVSLDDGFSESAVCVGCEFVGFCSGLSRWFAAPLLSAAAGGCRALPEGDGAELTVTLPKVALAGWIVGVAILGAEGCTSAALREEDATVGFVVEATARTSEGCADDTGACGSSTGAGFVTWAISGLAVLVDGVAEETTGGAGARAGAVAAEAAGTGDAPAVEIIAGTSEGSPFGVATVGTTVGGATEATKTPWLRATELVEGCACCAGGCACAIGGATESPGDDSCCPGAAGVGEATCGVGATNTAGSSVRDAVCGEDTFCGAGVGVGVEVGACFC